MFYMEKFPEITDSLTNQVAISNFLSQRINLDIGDKFKTSFLMPIQIYLMREILKWLAFMSQGSKTLIISIFLEI